MENPISHIIPDQVFAQLIEHNLINKRVLRDMGIKHRFQQLRVKGMGREQAFSSLAQEYPALQYHTLRKIVYSAKLPDEL